MKRGNILPALMAFLLLSGFVIFIYIGNGIKKRDFEKRDLLLKNQLKESVYQLKKGIEQFSLQVSALRAYIESYDTMPAPEELHAFVNRQMRDLANHPSLVISFIDTAHIFQFSFSLDSLEANKLAGQSVKSIRDHEEIARLEALMENDHFQVFGPMNLIEGWVGIPINFRVKIKDQVIGYMAPIINFKSIIDNIYNSNSTSDFIYHFLTEGGKDFDRVAVYDGTTIFNERQDPESYKNFNVDPSTFQYAELSTFGYTFKIGIAYKYPYTRDNYLSFLLYSSFFLIFLSASAITIGYFYYKNLSTEINKKNEALQEQYQELNKAKEQLEALNLTNNKLFSVISHDIRTPLSAVISYLSLLKMDLDPDPETQELYQDIEKSFRGVMKLLDNLLEWAMLQTNSLNINLQSINVSDVANETIYLLKPAADKKSVRITKVFEKDVPALGDKKMTATILRNLLSNAIKFSHLNGTINLAIEEKPGEVVVSVVDQGVGISEEGLKNIFFIDKKEVRQGTASEKGTGLGLVLCKEFVERQMGRFWVTSEVGKGSTFYFSLPTVNNSFPTLQEPVLSEVSENPGIIV